MAYMNTPYVVNYIGIPYDGHKQRIRVTSDLEKEMSRKYNRKDFRISALDGCIICQYKENLSSH